MTRIPLITSIPPRLNRKNADGLDLGERYQSHCISSWCAAGFAPFSVNSEAEIPNPAIGRDVTSITVGRDGTSVAGRPYVYLSDALVAAKAMTRGVIVLTNADVFFEMNALVYDFLKNIRPNQFTLSKRRDVKQFDTIDATAKEYPFGYDFFAIHTDDIDEISSLPFMLGAPWWDHYFPIDMALRGMEFIRLPQDIVFHLEHAERWDRDLWTSFGRFFMDIMHTKKIDGSNSIGDSTARYLLALSLLDDPNQANKLRRLLRHPVSFLQTGGLMESRLADVSTLNINFIDSLIRNTRAD